MSYSANLKVTHLTPDFAAFHLYNKQLVNALRAQGVYLKTIRTKNFIKPVLQFRPHMVHIHWLHSFIETEEKNMVFFLSSARMIWFALQLIIVAACGIKIVWTVHELEIPETNYPNLDKLCVNLVSTLATAIITHCPNAQKQVIDSYSPGLPDKVKVVPHGNFIEVIENHVDRKTARQTLNIPESAFVILSFGLIRPYKGITELIEAHKQLKRDDVILLIAGGTVMHHQECADYMANIEQAISGCENIRLMAEYIPDDQIQTFMNSADVVAFPYRAVMTSGALIMAMGFGKPCIASRVGCLDETLDDKGAFLYESTDKSGLLKSLITCLADREKLKDMGEHNRSFAQNINWQHIAKLTMDTYQSSL